MTCAHKIQERTAVESAAVCHDRLNIFRTVRHVMWFDIFLHVFAGWNAERVKVKRVNLAFCRFLNIESYPMSSLVVFTSVFVDVVLTVDNVADVVL